MDRDIHSTVAKDGDKNKVIAFSINSGYNSSAMEHALWEQVYNLPGVSAVKVHQLANETGIPIHKIDESNISSILPLLQISQGAKSDITNAVNAGKIVYVPQRNIQYFDWNGTAYIVMDPNTGVGGYIISGGLSGGVNALLLDCVEALVQLLDLIPLPPVVGTVPGAIFEVLAFAASLHDIARSDAPTFLKGIAVFQASLSLIVGLTGNILGVAGIPGWILNSVVSIAETLLYISISRIINGGLPFKDYDPIADCKKLKDG